MMRYFHLPAGPENLRISARAVVLMPFSIREGMLARQASGQPPTESSRQGFIYAYADKALRQALRMGDLLHLGFRRCGSGCAGASTRKTPFSPKSTATSRWTIRKWSAGVRNRRLFSPPISATPGGFWPRGGGGERNPLRLPVRRPVGPRLRPLPYTSSFNTLAGFAAVRSGMPGHRPDRIVGTLPAYSVGLPAARFRRSPLRRKTGGRCFRSPETVRPASNTAPLTCRQPGTGCGSSIRTPWSSAGWKR